MLAGVLNIPHTNEDWAKWSWDHRLSHERIIAGIQSAYSINLTEYQVDPIDPLHIDDFLQNNASLHSDMNGVLGLFGIDLLDADLSNDNQKVSWINFHYLEHFYAENKLGVGS
jgi:hypothetical protein